MYLTHTRKYFIACRQKFGLSARTSHPPPLTKISSRHPEGVRRSFLCENLYLFKASFRVISIKRVITGNPLYYFLYFATFNTFSGLSSKNADLLVIVLSASPRGANARLTGRNARLASRTDNGTIHFRRPTNSSVPWHLYRFRCLKDIKSLLWRHQLR